MTEPIFPRVDDPAVHALLPGYLSRRGVDVTTMRHALEARRYDEIALVAHRLRGSGAAYGLPTVSRIGRRLERAARERDTAAVRESIDQLDHCIARVRVAPEPSSPPRSP